MLKLSSKNLFFIFSSVTNQRAIIFQVFLSNFSKDIINILRKIFNLSELVPFCAKIDIEANTE